MPYTSAVAITPVDITRDGKTVEKVMVEPTATNGNKIVNDGKTFIYIINGSAAPITATIDIIGNVDGLDLPDKVLNLAATASVDGKDKQFFGPFSSTFNQSDGYIWIVCSAVTNVKIGAFRV